ncbi:hypothetical protein BAE44_0017373 [Dichanthelium oligosanthes]|uniref:Uncharacterized protein n=1 Tax=Dichanthelium oligosanthes TaxID=888268 RepID=A0A1E5V8X1_9POAL|nr:hypothetical protein BAE44_0017373 [Dichanthelium oligosanthes]
MPAPMAPPPAEQPPPRAEEQQHREQGSPCPPPPHPDLPDLTGLLAEVGLNIRQAHVYTTIDGFCLGIFVVDGWETELILQLFMQDAEELIAKIKEKLALRSHRIKDKAADQQKISGTMMWQGLGEELEEVLSLALRLVEVVLASTLMEKVLMAWHIEKPLAAELLKVVLASSLMDKGLDTEELIPSIKKTLALRSV